MKFTNALKQQLRAIIIYTMNRVDYDINDLSRRKDKSIYESTLRPSWSHLLSFPNLVTSDYMYTIVTIIGYPVSAYILYYYILLLIYSLLSTNHVVLFNRLIKINSQIT